MVNYYCPTRHQALAITRYTGLGGDYKNFDNAGYTLNGKSFPPVVGQTDYAGSIGCAAPVGAPSGYDAGWPSSAGYGMASIADYDANYQERTCGRGICIEAP